MSLNIQLENNDILHRSSTSSYPTTLIHNNLILKNSIPVYIDIKVNKDTLVMKALSIMNENKITSLCVINPSKKNKTIGIVHIHNLLQGSID